MALILRDVGYTYAAHRDYATRALSGVTMTLEPGKMLLVVGATGSGKTTLLRVCAGLLSPESGSATIDGEQLTPLTARGRVGLVFQDPESQLFADTLIDDVAFGPANLGATQAEARGAAAEALALVGLDPEEFGGRSPFSLSGGEARRAAIAGVLAMRPRYVLADEPTAGLDARGRRAVRELLARQCGSSGVLVVSHAAEEFLGLADELVVLAEGGVEWSGSASAVISAPETMAETSVQLPDVLEVQRLVRMRGGDLSEPSLDPEVAASHLSRLRGGF